MLFGFFLILESMLGICFGSFVYPSADMTLPRCET